jgi:hypothetical protein
MKGHTPMLLLVPFIVFGCYFCFALFAGSLRLRDRKEPIRRQESPREYWYHIGIICVLYATVVIGVTWMLLWHNH